MLILVKKLLDTIHAFSTATRWATESINSSSRIKENFQEKYIHLISRLQACLGFRSFFFFLIYMFCDYSFLTLYRFATWLPNQSWIHKCERHLCLFMLFLSPSLYINIGAVWFLKNFFLYTPKRCPNFF